MLWFSFQDASLSLQDNVTNFVILILYCFKALWILLLMGKKKKRKKKAPLVFWLPNVYEEMFMF